MFSRFLTIATLALAATGLAQAQAPMTYTQVVQNIEQITDVSANTNDIAKGISFTNFFTTAPKVIDNFRQIIQLATDDIGAMGDGKPTEDFVEEGQTQICDAFRTFVRVHQALLNTMIGKHGILSQTPYTQPIAQVLRTLEGGVDTLAFGIIDMVPSCAAQAQTDANALGQTLGDAIETYSN